MTATINNERFDALRAKALEASSSGNHASSVLSSEELQELRQGYPARLRDVEEKNAQIRARTEEMKKANQKRQEEFRQFIRDQAEQDGVDLPADAVDDLSVTGYAIRCQFYLDAYKGNAAAQSYWTDNLEKWFARPKFDLSEFNRLCDHYGLAKGA